MTRCPCCLEEMDCLKACTFSEGDPLGYAKLVYDREREAEKNEADRVANLLMAVAACESVACAWGSYEVDIDNATWDAIQAWRKTNAG